MELFGLVLILFLLILLIFLSYGMIGQKCALENLLLPENNKQISAILLSHNRPWNLHHTLPILVSYPEISDVHVFHGLAQYYDDTSYPKTTHYRDFNNNELWGAARRFFHFPKCRQNLILFLDDDLLPSQEWIRTATKTAFKENNRDTVYGSVRRGCNGSGYHVHHSNNDQEEAEILLTSCALLHKTTVLAYMEYFPSSFAPWLHRHKGNCEDISMNLFVRHYFKETPVFIPGTIQSLDKENGYHSLPDHYKDRSEFCRLYSSMTFPHPRKRPARDKEAVFQRFLTFYDQHKTKISRPPYEKHVDGLDAIYCITLPVRKSYISSILEAEQLLDKTTFMEAITFHDLSMEDYDIFSTTLEDFTSPIYCRWSKLPVHLSYLICMYDALVQGYRYMLILEDDIKFVEGWMEYVKEFLTHAQEIDVMYLGYCGVNSCKRAIEKRITKRLLKSNKIRIQCKHATLHNTRYFSHFFQQDLRLFNTSDRSFDQYYQEYGLSRCLPDRAVINQDRKSLSSHNENYTGLDSCIFE